jgi:hypothetical protein
VARVSTNYYLETPDCPNPCAHCAQDNLLHIGKTYGVGDGKVGVILRSYVGRVPGPDGNSHPLRDWADWKAMLTLREAKVTDQYGGERVNPAWLIDHIESISIVNRVKHAREHGTRSTWIDARGYSMDSGEFS